MADSLASGTCSPSGAVGAHHLSGSGNDSAGGSGRAGTWLTVTWRSLGGVAIKTVLAALAAQTGRVVLTVARSWVEDRKSSPEY